MEYVACACPPSSSTGKMFKSLVPLILCLLGLVKGVEAQTLQPDFADALVSGGWNAPVGVVWDDNGRSYVWEKGGTVWIVENGVRLPNPMLDISDEVGNWRDHGMLGFALDPQFLSNGRIYVLYLVDRHHLMNAGTAAYNPATNDYFSATIMRITRYTAVGPQFNVVDPASRFVLLGETPSTGVPQTHESHSTGSLAFGDDGTLLVTTGDGASYSSTDVGSAGETYWAQALADGIIRPEENVGAFRSQMLNSLNGKVLRLDPNTGDGVPSNPWYDPNAPRSTRSRVWGLGLRNPFRMTIRKGSGVTDPALGRPGVMYIGDVGWTQWEDLHVCYEGGMNFGWPLYEGMEAQQSYMNAQTQNQDAPNPLFDGLTCSQQFFRFMDLLKQDTPIHLNGHPNPCDASVQVPNTIPKFFHARPAIDWFHGNRSRTPGFSGGNAVTFDLDVAGSPVPGPRFGGNAGIAGPWMDGVNMPLGYQNSSFHGDFSSGWIRRFKFDENDQPLSVHEFATGLDNITWIGGGPDGCVWYMRYNSNQIRRICYTLAVDLPPVALASQSVQYGPAPLAVQFTGSGSSDPENGPLTYLWNFGNGQTSTNADPQHVFTAFPGVVTSYTVSLTVTDQGGQSASTTLLVSLNNTPPVVDITSFTNGGTYPVGVDSLYQLEAAVSDAEHGPGQLSYAWRTTLFHNTHNHPEPLDFNPISSTIISGVGCDGETFSYRIELTVTDAGGLSTTATNWLYPRCQAIAPTAIINASVLFGQAPLAVVLDGTDSYDPGTIVSYQWDLGDGTFSNSPSPVKIFTEPGDYYITLTVTDDDGLTGQAFRVITVIALDPPQCVGATGSITREYFANVNGVSVNDLLNSPNYPNNPTTVNYPTSFQGPVNAANNYGTRMRGYIVAPQTGNYVFTATSDDGSVVYLSPNSDPQFKQIICNVPGWTETNEFTKYAQQTSAPIYLVAGVYYYVEMLHKEGAGGDHLALWWQTPSNNTRTVVPGSSLARWVDCAPSLRVRVNLQGPWDPEVNQMRDDLRAAGLIPLTEPYTGLGFAHSGGGGGETVTPARLAVTGKNAIVDWVFVELRSAANPAVVVATRSAFLERDGDVVDGNGLTRLFFNVPAGQYRVAIKHRNHLGVMTNTAVALGSQVAGVDFTSGLLATHGTDARYYLPNGRYALWAGNVVRDGLLKYTGGSNDRDAILLSVGGTVPTNIVPGYLASDVNLDGQVKYTGGSNDRDLILFNIGGVLPTAVKVEQLP
jgi:PKD repeat protein/glucose/arabinose dehydrogenase